MVNSRFGTFLFWAAYLIFAGVATYHTYKVMLLSDPPAIAFMAALGVDAFLAYCFYIVGSLVGDQKIVGFVGVGVFAAISAVAQIINSFIQVGSALPDVLQLASMFLLPVSVTLSILTLGAIKFLGDNLNGGARREPRRSGREFVPQPARMTPPVAAMGPQDGRVREATNHSPSRPSGG